MSRQRIKKKYLVGDFVEKIQKIQTMGELNRAFDTTMQTFHFNRYAYQLIKCESYNQTDPLIVATYPEEWVRYYIEQSYNKIDPVITVGPKKLLPFKWSSLWEGFELSKKQKILFQEAEDFSVANGLGFPIHGPNNSFAMITMAAASDDAKGVAKIFQEHEDTLHFLSLYYHQAMCTILAKSENRHTAQPYVPLTRRETEILKWAAEQKSNTDIACILHISINSVDSHF